MASIGYLSDHHTPLGQSRVNRVTQLRTDGVHLLTYTSISAAFPAGVDPNRGSEETVRSPGVLLSANGIVDGVGGALSLESTSQTVRTNGHGTKTTGVPPQKAGGRRGACE